MRTGPLIPGIREFDAPRRRRNSGVLRWVLASVAIAAVITVMAGVLGGVGPLRVLGVQETPLRPIAWRPTVEATLVQVAVATPEGLCSGDEVRVTPVEGGDRIAVDASRVRARNAGPCSGFGIAGDHTWVDVRLSAPVGDRTMIRKSDRQPMPRQAPVDAGAVDG